jgi:CxxC motif-containing protein (DUF1111 family)/predicted lipoprotein with Yx(FWY)xxD motif
MMLHYLRIFLLALLFVSNAGYGNDLPSESNAVSSANLDFDKDGQVDALTDGLLFLRYAFGLRDNAMTAGAISQQATLSQQDIVLAVGESYSFADFDGNGAVDALTDGLLLLRMLFGLSGESLISGAVGIGATRTTTASINNYILPHMTPEEDASGDDESVDSEGQGDIDNINDSHITVEEPIGTPSAYCETSIFHLNNTNEVGSEILLTIEAVSASSIRVAIRSNDNDSLSDLSVESLSGLAVTGDNNAETGTLAKIMSWNGTAPNHVAMNILWSKQSKGGMWIVRDLSVPADATCGGIYNGGSGVDNDPNNDSDGDTDNSSGEYSNSLIDDQISVANGLLVGGVSSDKPQYVVYVFDNDLSTPNASSCYGGCAEAWPPVLADNEMPSGVMGLGAVQRNDGTWQVTYNDRPLYFYSGDQQPNDSSGNGIDGWHSVEYGTMGSIVTLYNDSTALEPMVSFVRDDGVVVTRFADRGRDRHAKNSGFEDHYDHYLAHYWEYRTMRLQFEDYVPTGQSRIVATWITEAELGAREFRVWYSGANTTGQFWFNPQKEEDRVNPNETGVVYHGSGTWDNNFVKTSNQGSQHKYSLNIIDKWQLGGQIKLPLQVGMNMEFEASMFLLNPPAGSRLNYYGTSFVYVIGQQGIHPFEWQSGQQDGTPIPQRGLSGGKTSLGYNYSAEPAGRFMQMATNMSPANAQPFVRGRRVHHTNFENGAHGERPDNPIWVEQVGKAGNRFINNSCANCHIRNGRALVADVGDSLDKWVFKVGDENGNPLPSIGRVLQPEQIGSGTSEGTVVLGNWTEHSNGLRSPNYQFSKGTPPQFSARIAPSIVGVGLLEAIDESTILSWVDEQDVNNDGISGRAAIVEDPSSGVMRLGRFGYKGATFSVKHQVASALNTDMGVMTSMISEPDCGNQQTNCGHSGAELADEHVNDLVKYLSLLGVGARRDYANLEGENIFAQIGCAGCHRPSMVTSQYHPLAELRGQTIYPYSDLLLHDMGEGLADSLGEGSASGSEWRTAPLWGLGLTKNVMLGDAKGNDLVSQQRQADDVNRIGYLHDGRARTIDEAIRWHAGEALNTKNAYEALSSHDRNTLLDFLESL